MEFVVERFFIWPPHIKKELSKLTLYFGGMKKVINSKKDFYTCIAIEGNKIVGWALLCNEIKEYKNVLMVYVDKNYRRKNIGTELVKELSKNINNFNVFGWNDSSYNFFKSLRINRCIINKEY